MPLAISPRTMQGSSDVCRPKSRRTYLLGGPPQGIEDTSTPAAAALEVITTFTAAAPYGTYAREVFADNPSVWYRLGEANAPLADEAGLYPLTVAGTPTFNTATLADPGNGSIRFATTSLQYAEHPNHSIFAPSSISVECLFQSDGVSGNNRLVQYGTDDSWRLLFIGPILYFEVLGKGYARFNWAGDTARHHVVGTYDATSGAFRLYLDGARVGIEQSSSTGAVPTSTGTFRIAQKPAGTVALDGWNGYLDEVAIYPSVLSQARVEAHAEAARFVAGQSALAVTATLSAEFPAGPQTADAGLAVTASLAAGSTADRPADASLAATVTLAASAAATQLSDAALAVTAAFAAAADRTATAAASLPLTASLAAAADTTSSSSAAASLSITATLAAAGVQTLLASASLSVTTTLTAAGFETLLAAAALSVTTTLTAAGFETLLVSASLSVTASLAATAVPERLAAAALSVTTTLAAAAVKDVFAAVALSVTTTLAAAAATTSASSAAASLAITTTLAAAAARTAVAAAALSITATLAAVGVGTLRVAGSLSITATLTALAGAALITAALSVTVTLSSAAARVALPTASLDITTSFSASAIVTRFPATTLNVTVTLTAGGFDLRSAAAVLAVVATLVATATAAPPAPDIYSANPWLTSASRSFRPSFTSRSMPPLVSVSSSNTSMSGGRSVGDV